MVILKRLRNKRVRVQKSKLEEVRHTKLRMNIFYQKLFYNSVSKKFLVVNKKQQSRCSNRNQISSGKCRRVVDAIIDSKFSTQW